MGMRPPTRVKQTKKRARIKRRIVVANWSGKACSCSWRLIYLTILHNEWSLLLGLDRKSFAWPGGGRGTGEGAGGWVAPLAWQEELSAILPAQPWAKVEWICVNGKFSCIHSLWLQAGISVFDCRPGRQIGITFQDRDNVSSRLDETKRKLISCLAGGSQKTIALPFIVSSL